MSVRGRVSIDSTTHVAQRVPAWLWFMKTKNVLPARTRGSLRWLAYIYITLYQILYPYLFFFVIIARFSLFSNAHNNNNNLFLRTRTYTVALHSLRPGGRPAGPHFVSQTIHNDSDLCSSARCKRYGLDTRRASAWALLLRVKMLLNIFFPPRKIYILWRGAEDDEIFIV